MTGLTWMAPLKEHRIHALPFVPRLESANHTSTGPAEERNSLLHSG